MQKLVIGLVATLVAVAAHAQNSTTNCYGYGNNVQCNTTTTPGIDWNAFNQRQQQINQQQQQINQQNQQNMNQAFQNLGAAIAARRERSRQRKALEAAQAEAAAAQAKEDARLAEQQAFADRVTHAMQVAIASDNTALPPTPSEKPVLLSCSVGNYSISLAIYEKAGRVDVTEAGVTRARAATFTPDAVSWEGSVWRTAVNRVDMSLISTARLPEMTGSQVTGTCTLAERKF